MCERSVCATALIALHQGKWQPEVLGPNAGAASAPLQEQQELQEGLIQATRMDALEVRSENFSGMRNV